jgi:hypothetical protein
MALYGSRVQLYQFAKFQLRDIGFDPKALYALADGWLFRPMRLGLFALCLR